MLRPVFGTEPPAGLKESYNNIKDNLFSVYPNPTSEVLNVKLISESFLEKNSGDLKIQILNSIGQIVFDENQNSKDFQVNTQNFSNGIYFLILKIDNKLVQQQKIIIQH